MREVQNIGRKADTVSTREALRRQLNVMHAVILRDIRSRYFNHGLGFLVVPLFPVGHALILLGIYQATGRGAIFGDDLVLFFATGLIPVLTFTYISRFMSTSIISNKSMLSFPAVHLLDIILARSVLEFVAIVLSIIFITVMLIALGSNPSPRSPPDAALALASITLLSIGIGLVVSVITAIVPIFSMLYAFFTVVIYLTSGAPIYLQMFPDEVLYYCSFNPTYHAVTWMRSAYYIGYPDHYFSKTYLLMWGMISLSTGLLMERLLRRQILS